MLSVYIGYESGCYEQAQLLSEKLKIDIDNHASCRLVVSPTGLYIKWQEFEPIKANFCYADIQKQFKKKVFLD